MLARGRSRTPFSALTRTLSNVLNVSAGQEAEILAPLGNGEMLGNHDTFTSSQDWSHPEQAKDLHSYNRGQNGAQSHRGFAASAVSKALKAPKLQTKSDPNQHFKDALKSANRGNRKDHKQEKDADESDLLSYETMKAGWAKQRRKQAADKMDMREYLSTDTASKRLGVSEYEYKKVARSLVRFQLKSVYRDQALALYVSSKAFTRLAGQFSDFVLLAATPDLVLQISHMPRRERFDWMFGLFAEYVVDQHRDELRSYRRVIQTLDLTKPYLWYPKARSLNRKIIYHAGPTNSGKTYSALQAMMSAESGIYCGPLRLLAMEIYDSCNAAGTYCNLLTGQERKMVPGAQHTSCTIEMMGVRDEVDVAVIDEIQLLGDHHRGWAWTRALQGVPAKEIHVCGDGSAFKLVQALAQQMNESVELREYERFSPLKVAKSHLVNGWQDIQPGDCVVAFSRKKIYQIKGIIESLTGQRACLIYGALPPETRRNQAREFNNSKNSSHLMVASDAVGMGLNLNIRRIIFESMTKVQRDGRVTISTSDIKQIAGRAGRRNSNFSDGIATCLREEDMPVLREAVKAPMSHLSTPSAGLLPSFEHIEAYAGQSLQTDFQEILDKFATFAKLDGFYFFCRQDDVVKAASILAAVPNLSLQERYDFCTAPAKLSQPQQAAALLHFAFVFAAKQPVELELSIPEKLAPDTPEGLRHLEELHQIVSTWQWLSCKYEDQFPGQDEVQELSDKLVALMDKGLAEMKTGRHWQGLETRALREEWIHALEVVETPVLRNLCQSASTLLKVENTRAVTAIHDKFSRLKRIQQQNKCSQHTQPTEQEMLRH